MDGDVRRKRLEGWDVRRTLESNASAVAIRRP